MNECCLHRGREVWQREKTETEKKNSFSMWQDLWWVCPGDTGRLRGSQRQKLRVGVRGSGDL